MKGSKDEYMEDLAGSTARFSDLKEPQNMKKAITKMGKTKFHTYKIIAISVKLCINISAGILFYTLNIGLFNVLSNKNSLYNQVSIVSISLMQISYLNMEKVMWREDRFLQANLTDSEFFSRNDVALNQLLENIEDKMEDITNLLKILGLKTPNDNWYNNQFFELKRSENATIEKLTTKEGISQLLSNAFSYYEKPITFFSRDRVELQLFFENCRLGLEKGTSRYLEELHDSHTIYSKNRRNLLLMLLLIKMGLGVVFIVSTMITYTKENSRKEKVVSLYYGFMQKDVKQIILTNERLLTTILSKDYYESEAGIEYEKVDEKRNQVIRGSFQDNNMHDDNEDEHSMHMMLAKRSKTKGRLDKIVDFNKFFIIFFALINTLYFVFLYFWNISYYMEYWGLARLSRDNNILSIGINNSYNKFITSIYNSRTSYSYEIDHIEDNVNKYHEFRKESLIVGLSITLRSSSGTNTQNKALLTHFSTCFLEITASFFTTRPMRRRIGFAIRS